MAAGENENEIIELLKNATPGNISKATKYGVKIFQGKSIRVIQSKTMQVETICTMKK